MSWILFGGLALFIAAGMPIAFALAIASVIAMLTIDMGLTTVPITLFQGASSFVILAVPLFILMGELMSATSIASRLVEFASALVGWTRGGLANVNVVSNMFMAEISGSAVADAAVMGKIFVPQMAKAGYPVTFAVSVTSAAAIIGIIIPPSIPMVLYGAVTNTSIRDMFIAGVVPGILLGVAFIVTNYIFARREGYPMDRRFDWYRTKMGFRMALVPLGIPVVVVGGLISGVFTPTEAAAIGVAMALLFGLARRELSVRKVYRILVDTAHQTSAVMLIVAGSAVLGQVLANEQVPQQLAGLLSDGAGGSVVFLLLVNVILLLAGMFLQATAAIIVIVPVLMPVAMKFGIDPVHFGVMVCVNLAVGQQTPPVATVLMTVCGISGVKMHQTFRYMGWYIVAMLVVLAMVTYIPYLTTWFM